MAWTPIAVARCVIIVADAHRRRGVAKIEDLVPTSSRAVAEYLSVLDDAAFSGATPVEPKVISPTDPAARYTASANSVAGYAYSDNYLVDLKHAVIVDVEATTTIRQAEVGAAKTMLDRTAEQFDLSRRNAAGDQRAPGRPRSLLLLAPIMSFWVLIAFSLFARSLVPICKG